MKNIKNKDLIFYVITVLLGIIMYGRFILIHYSTDMYNIINIGYINYAINNSLTDGRIFMSIINFIGDFLKLRPEIYKSILTILSILVSSISVIKLKNIILQYKSAKNLYMEVIVYLIAFCTIFNFILVEYMYYLESFIISIAILLIIYAANTFINKNKRYFVKTLLFCILSVLCYQATIPFFIGLVFTLSIIKNKNNYKAILKETFTAGIILTIAVFINMLTVKVLTTVLGTRQTRISFNIDVIKYNFSYIINDFLWIFWNQCNLYVDGLFLTLLIGTLLISCFTNNKKNNILNICLIVLVTILVNFAMHVPALTAYYSGRTKFAIGTLLGLIFIYIYTNTEVFSKDNLLSNIMIIVIITYLSSNIIAAINLTMYNKQVNELERKEVLKIEEYIEDYEKNNNEKIDKIAIIIIYGKDEKAFYDEIDNKSTLSQNAVKCDWSADGVINFYTNRKLQKIELTQNEELEYLSYFENDDYMCVGDKLVVKAYMQ